MTEKELSKYYYLKKEVEDIENRLKEFGDGVGAIKYNESIKGVGGKSLSVQEKKMQLYDMYMEKRVSALEEYLKIENYISSIDDPYIRTIVRLRHIDLLTWNEIADRISINSTKDITDYAIKKRYYRFFKKK